jgi:hypothetical protein
MDAGLLRGRGRDHVELAEDRHDPAAVDSAVRVEFGDQGVVGRLVVAQVDVDERLDTRQVGIDDTDLDGVCGDPRRGGAR